MIYLYLNDYDAFLILFHWSTAQLLPMALNHVYGPGSLSWDPSPTRAATAPTQCFSSGSRRDWILLSRCSTLAPGRVEAMLQSRQWAEASDWPLVVAVVVSVPSPQPPRGWGAEGGNPIPPTQVLEPQLPDGSRDKPIGEPAPLQAHQPSRVHDDTCFTAPSPSVWAI